jgi:ubiquinone/menaquinone biosynthesis C-methylase UbiE
MAQPEPSRHFDPTRFERLLAPERDAWARPAELMGLAGVRADQVWVDAACGPGYFARQLARTVGAGGHVTCLDDTVEMLVMARQRLGDDARISYVRALCEATGLGTGVVDGVFCAFAWHELHDREAGGREFARIVRPGGAVVIVDWRRIDPPPGPPTDHRLSRVDFLAPLVAAGLDPRVDTTFSPYFDVVTARIE